jgi:hypothetical protein
MTRASNDSHAVSVNRNDLDPVMLEAKRVSLDQSRVAFWMDNLDNAPPIVVFGEVGQMLFLANGYHRVEAARRVGRACLEAEVRPGGRQQATTYRDFGPRVPHSDLNGS